MVEDKKCSEQATRELIENNIGLVHSCAKRFCGRGIEYDDLYGAGCLGLVKAANGFDEARGFAFSTYAVPAILGEIKRLFRDGGSIKVSRSLKEKAKLALSENERLTLALGREPTVSELSEQLGCTASEMTEILGATLSPLSLTSDFEGNECQIEIPTESHEDELLSSLMVRELMDSLEPCDKKLIELRYFRGMTQSKTAQMLGMTQVGVSRREKRLLLMMRQKAEY